MENCSNYSSGFEDAIAAHHIFRSILLSFVYVFGTVGNMLLFSVILRKGRIANVTNLFNLNLAVGDLIRIFVFIPVYLLYSARNEWPPGLGYVGCKTVFMIVQSSLTVSIVTLMFMSIERYQAVVKPLKKQVTTEQLRCFLNSDCMLTVTVNLITLQGWSQNLSLNFNCYKSPYK